MSEIITATLNQIRYRKPDSKWSIVKTNKGIAKGVILWEPSIGDILEMEGKWGKSDFNGDDEFSFFACRLSIPEDPQALLYYAVSLTKGLGMAKRDAIWDKYGNVWKSAIPLDIKGVGKETQYNWEETLRDIKFKKAQADTIAFLLSKGCSLNMANLAWEAHAENTFTKVNANCYCLAELPNYGFRAIDEAIRTNFGISDNDQRRLDSALLYAMGELLSRGDTLVDYFDLSNQFACIVPDCVDRLEDAITNQIEASKVRYFRVMDVGFEKDYKYAKSIWERWA